MRHEHGFQTETSVETARSRFLELVEPLERVAQLPIGGARGRILAEAVTADRDVPHYDRAAMDGWAVNAADTHGASTRSPRTLEVRDEPPIEGGDAYRVHTGSPIPPGADAVVMIEDATAVGERVEITSAVSSGRHVGAAGEDIERGSVVLEAGATITPSAIALLKSLEVQQITVFDRPVVAVIPTGEELVQTDPAPGEVIETNGLMVSQYVETWGGRPMYLDVVADDPPAIQSALLDHREADIIVTTGGSSVGARDHLPEVIDDIGELVAHGVALQPGHPVGLGHVDGTPIAMLPGYPVSCGVTATTFLRPAVRTCGRFRDLPDPTRRCELTEKITSKVGKRTHTRVSLSREGDRWLATPTMTSGAGILSSMAQTDAIVIVPESVEGFNEGETVTAVIWE